MGTKFGQQEAIPENEYIAELHKKFEVIRERIQAYDKICEDFVTLSAKIDGFDKKIVSVSASVSDLEKTRDVGYQEIYDKFSDLNRSFLEIWQNFSDHEDKISILNKVAEDNFSECRHLLESLGVNLKRLSIEKANDSDLQAHKRHVEALLEKTSKDVQSQNVLIEDLKSKTVLHADLLAKKAAEVEEHGRVVQRVNLALNRVDSKMSGQIQNYVDMAKAEQQRSLQEFRGEMREMEERIVGSPNSNASIEARILNRMEMSSLDSSNALLLSRNLEAKLKILEKKIEALTLTLDKIDLKT